MLNSYPFERNVDNLNKKVHKSTIQNKYSYEMTYSNKDLKSLMRGKENILSKL